MNLMLTMHLWGPFYQEFKIVVKYLMAIILEQLFLDFNMCKMMEPSFAKTPKIMWIGHVMYSYECIARINVRLCHASVWFGHQKTLRFQVWLRSKVNFPPYCLHVEFLTNHCNIWNLETKLILFFNKGVV